MQLAIIKITKDGSDEAVVLNGNIILTADPGCGDSLENIEEVADNLAATLQINIHRIQVAPALDWTWEEIIEDLKADNSLISQTPTST